MKQLSTTGQSSGGRKVVYWLEGKCIPFGVLSIGIWIFIYCCWYLNPVTSYFAAGGPRWIICLFASRFFLEPDAAVDGFGRKFGAPIADFSGEFFSDETALNCQWEIAVDAAIDDGGMRVRTRI